jgi:putative SOS response-associated peptidase YedK
MCGRYALHAQPEVIALQFGVPPPVGFAPHFNLAPCTRILAVADGDYARWLDPLAGAAAPLALLGPCPRERVAPHPAGSRVNSVRNDDESCAAPLSVS